jgi:Ca-activated chloride channel family protein
LNDSLMEKLADEGNGNYAYIDTLNEAQKVLVDQISGTLVTIAKDVKIQVDFNAARVHSYRLIGYENRRLRAEDFQDDSKDAGEIGAGHTVTALYDIVPVGQESDLPSVTPSKYQQATAASPEADSNELLTVRLRYKQPDGQHSQEVKLPVIDADRSFVQASQDLQFAAAVAAFGMLLRESKHKGTATWDDVIDIARKNVGDDPHGYRREFISLAEQAREFAARQVALQR